jgi:hypothetical protein
MPDAPSADAVVLPVDRASRTALGCAGAIGLFLLAITAGAVALAVNAPATVHKVIAVACAAASLALLATLTTAAVRSARNQATLALDHDGLWWTHRNGTTHLPWQRFVEAGVLDRSGPKRGRSGQPQLDLLPADPAQLTAHETLREKLTAAEQAPEQAPEQDESPRLRLRFALPDARASEAAADALRRFAPDLFAPDLPETR